MTYSEPHTHPLRETLNFEDVSELAQSLAIEVIDICRPEELYALCERYLDLARLEGPRNVDQT